MEGAELQNPSSAGEARLVLITHPVEGAREFAGALVAEGLAACVNLSEVDSVYRWEGRVEESRERLLMLKTSHLRLSEIRSFLESRHPYDVPEMISIAPDHVEEKYLHWLLGEVQPEVGGAR